jgi:hypothetical protein
MVKKIAENISSNEKKNFYWPISQSDFILSVCYILLMIYFMSIGASFRYDTIDNDISCITSPKNTLTATILGLIIISFYI